MKKVLIAVIFLSFTASLFCQDNIPSKPLAKKEFIAKSRDQKTWAWVLLGSGSLILGWAATGYMPLDIAGGLIAWGGLSVLGSIPLFIVSAQNKRKAANATAYFRFEKTPFMQQGNISVRSFPAFTLKLSL